MEIKLLDTQNELKSFDIGDTDMIKEIHIFYHNNKEICFIEYSDKYIPMKILNDINYSDYKSNQAYFDNLIFDTMYNDTDYVSFDTNYIEIFSNLPGENNERIQTMKMIKSQKPIYMLLNRLQSDCEYYLGYGNRYAGHLWAKDEIKQIDEMKKLYNGLIVKPEWISLDDILDYEQQMCKKE